MGAQVGAALRARMMAAPSSPAGSALQAVESLQAAAPARIMVVIAAHNEAALLPFTLPPVLAQLQPGDELWVIDDGSVDGTARVAQQIVPPPPGRRRARQCAPRCPQSW